MTTSCCPPQLLQDSTAEAWSNETVDKILATVDLSRTVITLVAHAILPPPGGSVVGALLTMVHAVVQQSLCNEQMSNLTCRAAGHLNMICSYWESLRGARDKLGKCLTDFHSAILNITHLYKAEKEKGYLRRFLSTGQAFTDIAECEDQLAECVANLMVGVALDSHQLVLDNNRMLLKSQLMQKDSQRIAEEMQQTMQRMSGECTRGFDLTHSKFERFAVTAGQEKHVYQGFGVIDGRVDD